MTVQGLGGADNTAFEFQCSRGSVVTSLQEVRCSLDFWQVIRYFSCTSNILKGQYMGNAHALHRSTNFLFFFISPGHTL